MMRSERRLTTRTWLIVAVVAVVLTGWPGVIAVLAAVAYVAYRGRPGELVLLAAAGVGLTALVVLLEGLPSPATLSPAFVADNWLANALGAISLTLATVGVLSEPAVEEEAPVDPAPAPVPGRRRPRWREVIVAAAVAASVGAGFAAIHAAGSDAVAPPIERQIAARLLAGDGYRLRDATGIDRPTALRMPVVPTTLAALTTGNAGRSSQQALWALAGVATALVSAATAWMLLGRRAGLATGLLVLALPVFVIDNARHDSTAIAALVLAALVAALVRSTTSPSRAWPVVAGCFGGLLALTRPEGLVLALVVICVWLATRPRTPSYRVARALLLCALLVLVAPWLLRNRDQLGTWWPTTAIGPVVAGSNAASTYASGDFLGSYDPEATSAAVDDIPAQVTSEASISDELLRDGISYATRHPVHAARASGARLLRAFELWDGRAEQRVQRARGVDVDGWAWRQASFVLLLALGAVGVVRAVRRRLLGPLLPALAGVGAAAVLALLTYGDPVVRSVVDPLIAVAAGAAFARTRAPASELPPL